MKMVPLDIVDGSYKDEDLSFSAQDTVNYLPTVAEQNGTRTPTMLKTPPGLKPSVAIGINDGDFTLAGPVRGTYNAEGRFFAVAGNKLFQITTAGISVPIGTIPGVGRVSFSHNQITNGNEILVNNGNAGYIYNTVTQVFQRITDTGYPGGLRAVFINNRFIQIEPARRYVFNSDLADGLNYNALDRFTSETSPDLVTGIEAIANQLAVFSTGTTEWFEDTGANPQPFRSTGIVADKGAAGPFTTAKMDNALFMFGSDGIFYRFNGYNPVRISTKPIEQAVRGLDWWNCFTTVWINGGYSVCYWTFPNGQTWGYDASTNKWHRRESYGFNRWRLNSLTYWQNKYYGGDFQAGRLYELDWDYILEGSEEIESIRACGVVADNQNRVIHERLELVMNTGMVETVPVEFGTQPEGPSISGDAPNGAISVVWGPYTYTASGGTPPYRFTTNGALPNGFGPIGPSTGTLPSTTPTVESINTFTVRVTDANGLFAELTDTISIGPPVFGSLGSLVYASEDGATWNSGDNFSVAGVTSPNLVQYANGKLFVFQTSGGAGAVSNDSGATFGAIAGLGSSTAVNSLIWTGTEYLLFCQGGDCHVSTDGSTFTTRTVPAGNLLGSAKRGNTIVVGRNNERVAVSTDNGATFTNHTVTGLSPLEEVRIVIDIGNGFALFGSTGDFATSPDGVAWTVIGAYPAPAGTIGASYNEDMDRIGAVYTTGFAHSDDKGVTWTTGPLVANNSFYTPSMLSFERGYYIFGAAGGEIWTSQDFIAWTKAMDIGANDFRAISGTS